MPTDTGAPWYLPSPLNPETPDGPGNLASLAGGVAAALGRAYPCLFTARPSPVQGMLIYETDTHTLLISEDGATWRVVWCDPGYTASGDAYGTGSLFTATAGFTGGAGAYWKTGGGVLFYQTIGRTGTTLASNTSGNITNTQMGVLATGWRPPTGNWSIHGGGSGGNMMIGYVDQSGVVAVGAMPSTTPGGDWAAGINVVWTGFIPLGTG